MIIKISEDEMGLNRINKISMFLYEEFGILAKNPVKSRFWRGDWYIEFTDKDNKLRCGRE